MIKRLYDLDKEWLLKVWFEEGSRVGSYLRMFLPKLEEVSGEVNKLRDLLPLKRVEAKKSRNGRRKAPIRCPNSRRWVIN